MTKKTFYDVLQVSPGADPEIIKAAYRSLVQRYHPDKNASNPDAEQYLKIINRAYGVLSDPVKRAAYDAGLMDADENQTNQPDSATSTKETTSAPEAIPSKENVPSSVPDQHNLKKGDATTFPNIALEMRNVLLLFILGVIVVCALMIALFPQLNENEFNIGYNIGYWLGVAIGPRHNSQIGSGTLLTMMLIPNMAYILYKIRLFLNAPADDSVQESGSGILGLYKVIIGEKNTSYYTTKFEQFDRQGPGFKASWNWPAFFCNYAWALYRKMYGWFFAILGISVISIVIAGAGAPVIWFVALVANAAFGVYANSIYHGKAREKIAMARLTFPDEPRLLARLRNKGGVNTWVIWVSIGWLIIGILAAIYIPAYNDSRQPASPQNQQPATGNIFDQFDKPQQVSPQNQQPATGGYGPNDTPVKFGGYGPNDTLVDGASPQIQQSAPSGTKARFSDTDRQSCLELMPVQDQAKCFE